MVEFVTRRRNLPPPPGQHMSTAIVHFLFMPAHAPLLSYTQHIYVQAVGTRCR